MTVMLRPRLPAPGSRAPCTLITGQHTRVIRVTTESAPPEPTTPAPPRRRARARRPGAGVAVAIAYVSGIFVTAMDMHIVNVALPTLSTTFPLRSPMSSGR